MHVKKFAALFVGILGLGLLMLTFKDILFINKAESQAALVAFHAPGPVEKFYKMSGEYEEKTLKPAIVYEVDGTKITYLPEYSCKDGCEKVGTEVTVFYQKEKPQEALIITFNGFWKYKIYFMIIMGVLLLTSLPYVFYNSSKQPVSGSNG